MAMHEKRNVRVRLPRSCSGSPQNHSGEEQNLRHELKIDKIRDKKMALFHKFKVSELSAGNR